MFYIYIYIYRSPEYCKDQNIYALRQIKSLLWNVVHTHEKGRSVFEGEAIYIYMYTHHLYTSDLCSLTNRHHIPSIEPCIPSLETTKLLFLFTIIARLWNPDMIQMQFLGVHRSWKHCRNSPKRLVSFSNARPDIHRMGHVGVWERCHGSPDVTGPGFCGVLREGKELWANEAFEGVHGFTQLLDSSVTKSPTPRDPCSTKISES